LLSACALNTRPSLLAAATRSGFLTALESSVLRGIRAGLVETELAKEHDCDVGVIQQYRRRIREKLGLPSHAPLQTIVGTAVQRGLLS
jgi:DNA-binding CsgD family transcriptional regulator